MLILLSKEAKDAVLLRLYLARVLVENVASELGGFAADPRPTACSPYFIHALMNVGRSCAISTKRFARLSYDTCTC